MIQTGARVFSLLAAVALALGGLPASSQARTIMASAGRAAIAADYGCFLLNGSTMINSCGSAKRLETSLPTDAGGTYTVKVSAQGPSPASNVGCEAVGVNATATAYWGSGVQWLPAFPAAQVLNLITPVPAGGTMFAYCDVYPNGRVNTISW
jgi:hypothetical protein